MANFCDFTMKITGNKSNVEELIAMLRWQGEFKENGLGRIFDCDVMEFDETQIPGVYEAVCGGDCAWSIKSSMRDDGVRERSLESESERLELVVEAYSSEPGNSFQEHLLIVKGDVVTDDCVDYEEHCIDENVTLEQYNQANDTDFTEDMVNDERYVCIGGFGDDYGVFEDGTRYFVSENTKERSSFVLEEQEVCALYESDNEFCSIVKAPNGKFFNYYSKDGLIHGYGSAGPFDSLAEAEVMMLKHRPQVKIVSGEDKPLSSLTQQIKMAESKSGVFEKAPVMHREEERDEI